MDVKNCIGVKYCGSCISLINRKILSRRLAENLIAWNYTINFQDYTECRIVVVIHGCFAECADTPEGKTIITVCDTEVDMIPCSEEDLPDQITKRILEVACQGNGS